MIVKCEKCSKEFDDFDHSYYPCPEHPFIKTLSYDQICKLNDIDEGWPIGTTNAMIQGLMYNAS